MERPHGRTRYKLDSCRCFTCRLDYAAYCAEVREGRGPRATDYIPLQQVSAHLVELEAAGVGREEISRMTGITRQTLRRWRFREAGRAKKELAERVFAIPATAVPPRRWAPTDGSHRRMQALAALGWMNQDMAAVIGWTVENFTQLFRRVQVQRSTARAIGGMYEALSMRVPEPSYGSTRAKLRAHRRMWFPPLAWDDDALDDPQALPCLLPPIVPVGRDLELAVQHVAARHDVAISSAVRAEVVRRLPERKVREVAELVRCTRTAVEQIRRKLEVAAC